MSSGTTKPYSHVNDGRLLLTKTVFKILQHRCSHENWSFRNVPGFDNLHDVNYHSYNRTRLHSSPSFLPNSMCTNSERHRFRVGSHALIIWLVDTKNGVKDQVWLIIYVLETNLIWKNRLPLVFPVLFMVMSVCRWFVNHKSKCYYAKHFHLFVRPFRKELN